MAETRAQMIERLAALADLCRQAGMTEVAAEADEGIVRAMVEDAFYGTDGG